MDQSGSEAEMETCYMTPVTHLPPYLELPRFVLDMDINETGKILYTLLLDRARLSQTNPAWKDEEDHVFIIFPIRSMAERMHKSEMTIKAPLSTLEKGGMIHRISQGIGRPNRIYVKLPRDSKLSPEQTENCPPWGKKTIPAADRKLSSNNNYSNNTIKNIIRSNDSTYPRQRKKRNEYYNLSLYDSDENESL